MCRGGRPKPFNKPARGKTKDGLRKRNDESQTVDLMPAWRGKGATRCPGVFFLIQTRVAPSESPTCVAAANLPIEETEVAQRCEGVEKN
jgi:hypothetical protein